MIVCVLDCNLNRVSYVCSQGVCISGVNNMCVSLILFLPHCMLISIVCKVSLLFELNIIYYMLVFFLI